MKKRTILISNSSSIEQIINSLMHNKDADLGTGIMK